MVSIAVSDLSLEVQTGEVCVLVGPSGCGKTTTMRMINRLIEPTSGRIFLGDDDVTHVDPVELRRRIGYVIQSVGLFPHQTIGTNIATVPRLLGWDKARVRARVDELLELVGLDPSVYRDRYPSQLSGGQQQRVGVARALGADPPSCSWTSRSARSTRSPATGCRTSSSACRSRSRRRSCSSPTTSRRP